MAAHNDPRCPAVSVRLAGMAAYAACSRAISASPAGGSADRAGLVRRATGALKITEEAAQATLAELTDAGLLAGTDQVTATDAGRALFAKVRGDIGPIIERAYSGIPAEDLQTAPRVLTAVTAGLNRELPAGHGTGRG